MFVIISQYFLQPMKRYHAHNHRSKGELVQQKTQKMIELKAEKENFFEAVIKRMEKQFQLNHLELFIQHLEFGYQNSTKRKNMASNSNLVIDAMTEKNIQTPYEETEDVPFRKLDTALFQNFSKRLFPVNLLANRQEQRKYLSTPKNGKVGQKMVLTRRLFEVDTKMKRNYERIKQRLKMNNGDDSFRAINSIRTSVTVKRLSKTQRAIRFKTEGEEGERWIPRMLMGDLQLKPKERKTETRGEDRRMECFLSRYKINQ